MRTKPHFDAAKLLLAAAALTLALVAAPAAQAQVTDTTMQMQAQAMPNVQDSCDDFMGTIETDNDDAEAAAMAQVTEEQARDAALLAFAGATLDDIDIDEENGYLVWEVDIDMGNEDYEVYVDAGTGEVLCTERD